jgi:hypothetical protein
VTWINLAQNPAALRPTRYLPPTVDIGFCASVAFQTPFVTSNPAAPP